MALPHGAVGWSAVCHTHLFFIGMCIRSRQNVAYNFGCFPFFLFEGYDPLVSCFRNKVPTVLVASIRFFITYINTLFSEVTKNTIPKYHAILPPI